MNRLKRLVREAHRRSLWQVLAVYLAVSWVAIQVVDALTRTAGLPDWVPPFALILLVLGLPVVMATAVVQEGPAAPPPTDRDRGPADSAAGSSFLRTHLTWKRSMLAGAVAFALLALAVGGYFFSRATGVGPAASLMAQGVLEEGEAILLAEFGNGTDDAGLGAVVTEALRADLESSGIVSLVQPDQIADALRRMDRSPGEAVTAELAREIAVRDGIKAVLEGEVGAAGTGLIFTARLRSADDGRTLASFRRTARGPDGVIDAIDRLSQDIRERAGESLRSIRRGAPLWQVTTPSLEALRRYSEAERRVAQGDEEGGLALLGEAVRYDSAFAMAYRKQAAVLGNLRMEAEATAAIERAYRHRDRLTQKERYLTEAFYQSLVGGDEAAEIRAYEAVLRLDSLDPTALNNLANRYQARGDLELAETLYRRANQGPWPTVVSSQNLVFNLLRQNRIEDARKALAEYAETFPDDLRYHATAFAVYAHSGDLAVADRELDAILTSDRASPARRATATTTRVILRGYGGRIAEARSGLAALAAEAAPDDPENEYYTRLADPWMDLWIAADSARARARLAEIHASSLPERVPPESGQHSTAVLVNLMAGEWDRAGELLERWRTRYPDDALTEEVRASWNVYETWAAARGEDPAAVLQALEARRERCPDCFAAPYPGFLEAVGRLDDARAAWERLASPSVGGLETGLLLIPASLRNLARLAEEAGDFEAAAEYHRRFAELWAEADPELQPLVERARGRVAALTAGGS